jgi:hypothetical protein
MKGIYSEIEINASPRKVWDILTEFAAFPEWNPFVKTIEGKIEVGEKFRVFLQLPDSKEMTFRPKCLKAEQNKELWWIGHMIVPGLFDGEHRFTIEPVDDNKVRFIQKELFRGILTPLIMKRIGDKTQQGFDMMNRALKERAERS